MNYLSALFVLLSFTALAIARDPRCPTNTGDIRATAVHFQHDFDCRKFYKCSTDGEAHELTCSGSSVYDPVLQTCSFDTSICPQQSNNFDVNYDASICAGKRVGTKFLNPTDCSSYYICLSNGPLLQRCGDGLLYDTRKDACDWSENVVCVYNEQENENAIIWPEQPYEPEYPQNPDYYPQDPYPLVPSYPQEPSYPPQQPVQPVQPEKPQEPQLPPQSPKPQQPIQKPVLPEVQPQVPQPLPPQESIPVVPQRPQPPAPVQPQQPAPVQPQQPQQPNWSQEPSYPPQQSPNSNGPFRDARCPTFENPRSPVHLPHATDCNKFYKCLEGYAYLITCPAGQQWNEAMNWCDYPENARCTRL